MADKPKRGRKSIHEIEVSGAIAFKGHVTVFKTPKANRWIIIADASEINGVELTEKKK